ncbi:MAG: alpha-L-arabinofuranosidase C-terminal domain-containing protein, partial [Phycisphaerae bacterium]
TNFIRHADVVQIACLAQIVNVIAPILTRHDGLLIQSIYYPWVLASQAAKGEALVPQVTGPLVAAGERGDVPAIDAALTYDHGVLAAILVNRSLSSDAVVEVRAADRKITKVLSAEVLGGGGAAGCKLANSWEKPNVVKVVPGKTVLADGKVLITVPGPGFAVVRLATEA